MKKSRKESELHTVKLQIKGLESRLRYALSDRDNTARQIEASLFFFTVESDYIIHPRTGPKWLIQATR